MLKEYQTSRLLLQGLDPADADFIFELVNTPGWIQFIGDRKVKTKENAEAYIQKILANKAIQYWVVKLKESLTPIGIISFIQRDYLDHPDIGFAFLPAHAQYGYAHEASIVVLRDKLLDNAHATIVATTIPENKNSIKLLEKLGFGFVKEITTENELLLLYSITADR